MEIIIKNKYNIIIIKVNLWLIYIWEIIMMFVIARGNIQRRKFAMREETEC